MRSFCSSVESTEREQKRIQVDFIRERERDRDRDRQREREKAYDFMPGATRSCDKKCF